MIAGAATLMAGDGGLAFGPPIALVQQVQPGVPAVLQRAGSALFVAENRGASAVDAMLTAGPPATAGMPTWELGYEALPDPSWLRVDPAALRLDAGGRVRAGVTVQVPNHPRWANRRFCAALTLRQQPAAGVGAVLAIAARVLIETTPQPSAAAGADAPIATIPSQVQVQPDMPARVLVRCGDGRPRALAIRRLAEVEADPARRARYLSPGCHAAPEAWLTATLHPPAQPDGWTTLEIAMHRDPQDAATEELLFIGDAADLDARTGALAFVRVRP
jgi:hypothetical protein